MKSCKEPVDTLGICRRIVVENSRVSGLELIRRIGINLSRELGMKWAMIGRPDHEQVVHSDLMAVDAAEVDPISYRLEKTPCKEVLDGRRVCVTTNNVAEKYPDDLMLAEMGARSYAGTPLLTPEGELLGLVVVLHDEPLPYPEEAIEVILEFVGARVAVEFQRHARELEDQRRLQDAMQEEKLRSVGQVAGGVAHDFNNLLGAIIGHVELLECKLQDLSHAKHVRAILASARRGREITSQLTDYARPQESGGGQCSAHEVIDEAVQLLSATMRGLQVDLDKLALRHDVALSSHKLQQIIVNLMLNARDAMPQGGVLSITTRDLPDSDEMLLEVRDAGSGIAKEDLDRIFDPYFTTKGVEGTGLGLASASSLLQAVGGEIQVESQVGVGTKFSLRMPVVGASVRADEPVHSGRTRVMIVEDEPHVLGYLCERLELDGYEVTGFDSVDAARNAFSPDLFDVILSDLNFPRETSRSFLEHVHRVAPTVRTLLMTGDTGHADASALRDSGNCPVLAKPFEHAALIRQLEQSSEQVSA